MKTKLIRLEDEGMVAGTLAFIVMLPFFLLVLASGALRGVYRMFANFKHLRAKAVVPRADVSDSSAFSYEDAKMRFYRTFPNIPINFRREVIYVSNTWGPVTWQVIWLEVNADTAFAHEALRGLVLLKLI